MTTNRPPFLEEHLTLTEAKRLKKGDILHAMFNVNSDGTCQRWKVRAPPIDKELKIPVIYGNRIKILLTKDKLNGFHLPSKCLNPKKK